MSRASLCGPTNALTALQKHATSDRTLQQDRLRGPSIPQGFRSSHVSNINHEFDQFSQGPQDFFHAPPPSIGAVPNWAAEFQQLRIGNPPPLQHTIPRNTWASPVPATAAASWHTEFLAQLSQPTAYTPTPQQQFLHHQTQQHLQQQQFLQHQQIPQQQQQQQQQQQSAQFSGPELRTHSPSEYDSPNYLHDSQDPFYAHQHHHSDFTTTNEAYSSPLTLEQQAASDAAFALAFDEAQRWHLESTQHDLLDSINEPTPLIEESPEQKGKGKEKAEDPDELSRTAGHLLDSLASEQSQKFKESNFMKLMRQLRDKEVKVEGGEMVAVGGAS